MEGKVVEQHELKRGGGKGSTRGRRDCRKGRRRKEDKRKHRRKGTRNRTEWIQTRREVGRRRTPVWTRLRRKEKGKMREKEVWQEEGRRKGDERRKQELGWVGERSLRK